jgi:arylsulfatase A-like enzyme
MLEYMDDVLGRLFDYVERSKLRDDTYILVMGDNGAELFPEERKGMHRQVRSTRAAGMLLIFNGCHDAEGVCPCS